MAVVDINAYTQVINSTTPSWASGPFKRANETTRRQYTRTYVIAGKAIERLVRGGKSIQDMVFLNLKPLFRRHGPNPTFAGYEQPQTGTMWEVAWSRGTSHVAWDEDALASNQEANDEEDRAVKIKDYVWGQYQNSYTDLNNQEEDEYWATQSYLTMEALTPTGTRAPYSLPVFNNEFNNGLPYGFGTVAGGSGKVMQISRVDEANWRPQRMGYLYNASSDTLSIFASFKAMLQKCSFDPMPMNEEYGPQSVSPDFITCSHWGGRIVDHAMRKNQDAFRGFGPTVGRDAAYARLQFMGLPIVEIEKLNTALLYPGSGAEGSSGGTFVAENGVVSYTDSDSVVHEKGPRFQFWHNEDLHSVWRKGFHRELSKAFTPSNQPYAIVRIIKLQNNNYVSRSRSLGTMFPKTTAISDFEN